MLSASSVGIVPAVVGVALREVVLGAEAFLAVATVLLAEVFVAAFFPAATFFDATTFLTPTFLLVAPTVAAAFDLVAFRVADSSD